MPEHTQGELRVFEEFAKACPIDIELPSIEKRQPPNPDIYCRTADGAELFFELVEVVDSGVATVTSQQVRLQRQLTESAVEDKELRERFGNALIAVGFEKSLSMQRRRNAVPGVLQFLKELPAGFEGNVAPISSGLASTLSRLHVTRGNFVGPCFHVDGVTSFSDPTLETVFAKLRREYAVSAPLHLLAYFVLQPMDAGTEWNPQLEDHIRMLLRNSSFQSVWLFEWGSGRILEVGGSRAWHGS